MTHDDHLPQAIVAFSGGHEFGGVKVNEASLNGFPSKDIADKIQDDPYLSNILKIFNDNLGTLFDDMDRVVKRIRNDIAPRVAADKAFQNARDNTPHTPHTPHTARMAHDQALAKAAQILLKDDTLFYKQFVENESFRRSVGVRVYQITSQSPARGQP